MKWLAENKKKIIANVILIVICYFAGNILSYSFTPLQLSLFKIDIFIPTLIGGFIPGLILFAINEMTHISFGINDFAATLIMFLLCGIIRKSRFSDKLVSIFCYAAIFSIISICCDFANNFGASTSVIVSCIIAYLILFTIIFGLRRIFRKFLNKYFGINNSTGIETSKSIKRSLLVILNAVGLCIVIFAAQFSSTTQQKQIELANTTSMPFIETHFEYIFDTYTQNKMNITEQNILDFSNYITQYFNSNLSASSQIIPSEYAVYEIIDDTSLRVLTDISFSEKENYEEYIYTSNFEFGDTVQWSGDDNIYINMLKSLNDDSLYIPDNNQVVVYSYKPSEKIYSRLIVQTKFDNISYIAAMILQSATLLMIMNLLAIWLYDKKIIIPLNKMTSAASNFAFDTEENREEFHKAFTALDIKSGDEIEQLYLAFNKTISDMDDYVTQIKEKSEQISEIQHNIILTMADIVESRDENTGGHIRRTAAYVEIISKKLREQGKFADILTPQYESDMIVAAPLHDMGKIHVSDTILNKPGRLTDEEFGIMKTHTTAGKDMLENATNNLGVFSYLTIAVQMAAYHHEWWNGRGYPEGLSGNDIPLCARIMAVADVFDALMSKRCYKDAMPIEKAYSIIREETGTHFDPDVAEAFFAASDEIEACLNSME